MPSFSLLAGEDLESLVDYVIYLSVRGEVERRLIAAAIDDLGYYETSPEESVQLQVSGDTDGSQVVREILVLVAKKWQQAAGKVVPVAPFAPLTGTPAQESINRGKEIFHGQIVNCVGCHGTEGSVDVVTLDYDDWAKEYSTRIGLTPSDREAMRPFREAGALRPRPVVPRKLTDGVFQGGGDPETLFRRFTQGIAGTPMPTVEVVAEENGKGLTEDQVWDLVRYVRSLGSRE
jgi:mono/diheme cytochrome c family protein